MRSLTFTLPLLLIATLAKAGPMTGGPCVDGTGIEYASLGPAGCTASVNGYDLTVRPGAYLFGADNTPGATYPNISSVLIHPQFSAVANGIQESFTFSFVPGTWVGVPRQSLAFRTTFITTVNAPVKEVINQVDSTQQADLTSEVCVTNVGYVFGFGCAGQEFVATLSGTKVTTIASTAIPFSTFGISPGFYGVLPNGSFDGLATTALIFVTPEPASSILIPGTLFVFFLFYTVRNACNPKLR